MFVKLVSVTILIAICIVSLGAGFNYLLFNDSGQSLNGSDFGAFQWLAIVELLGLTATLIIAAWKIQVRRSKRIVFSFFFYGWRNLIFSYYSKFRTIFNLGNDMFCRVFCFFAKCSARTGNCLGVITIVDSMEEEVSCKNFQDG